MPPTLIAALGACTGSPPSSAFLTGSSTVDTATTPPPLACAEVTGTRAVLLVSRADPSVVVLPSEPLVMDDVATQIVGPDALGRLYLLDGGGALRVSSDDGCTWTLASTLPPGQVLLAAPTSARLYSVATDQLVVSDDAGVTFRNLVNPPTGKPRQVGIAGGSVTDTLLVYSDPTKSVEISVDGGLTWTTREPYPDPSVGTCSFDPWDVERMVMVGTETDLWVRDATGWRDRSPPKRPGSTYVPMWLDQQMVTLTDRWTNTYVRSPDGLPPYSELTFELPPEGSAFLEAMDGPDSVLLGTDGATWALFVAFVFHEGDRYEVWMPHSFGVAGATITPSSIAMAFMAPQSDIDF